VVSAPAGSGKTVLLRSWISEAGLAGRAARVSARRDDRDPQRFWLSVLGELRQKVPRSVPVRELTATPDLDGWAIVERLLKDLAPLGDQVWLMVDDVHELSAEVLRQLELLLMRAPQQLRFVLATRHDVRLGLHRLRLEGELTEIRAADLRFSLAEARELFAATGIELPEAALVMLHERTEGWAAGLRLAALSLSGHPDPERFAAEFTGSERTVADYLLAEVLERQPEEVRRLLLRTSVLDRVSGPLADALTGSSGGQRILQELEAANAFVVSVDMARSWFRYHHLFADLLRLELRRTAGAEVDSLHRAAARWFTDHGHPVDAVRHAQAAGEWESAARLLADHWPGLQLDGQAATVHELLARFPAEVSAAHPELAALAAADELAAGSLTEAARFLAVAARGTSSVPPDRRTRLDVLLAIVRLLLARQRMNLTAVAEEAQRLRAVADAPDAAPLGLGEELRALALISLGITEYWGARLAEAEPHLDQGIALARRISRPYLEFIGMAHRTSIASLRSSPYALAEERARQTIDLARRHGWTDEPAAGIAYIGLAAGLIWRRRYEEAADWVRRAERTLRVEAEPRTAMAIRYVRALLELARGRDQEVLATFQAAERLSMLLHAPDSALLRTRALRLHALVRLGEIGRAEQDIAEIGDQARSSGDIRLVEAALRIAQHDPHAATVALAPVLSGAATVPKSNWLAHAWLLETIARDALGDPAAAGDALRRALDLAKIDGAIAAFLLHPPARELFDRYAPHRNGQAALEAEIRGLLPAQQAPGAYGGTPSVFVNSVTEPRRIADFPLLVDPLSQSEIRVLRYLPTNLSGPEIARELSVSVTTVRTHIRHVFVKLGVHRRTEAVEQARALGLLAPSPDIP
jgi:LuxR family maltose regulon positive regulatory protein